MQDCCPRSRLPSDGFEDHAACFKALADPHRLTILAALLRAKEPICVCDFTAELPLNQPTVSHHLKILRDQGLVTSERRGTWVYYSPAIDVRERLRRYLDDLSASPAVAGVA